MISNSFGNNDAAIFTKSDGCSIAMTRKHSAPRASHSAAKASRKAWLILLRAPLARPPVFGRPFQIGSCCLLTRLIRTRRHSDRFISNHHLLKQSAFPQVVDQRPAANVTEAGEVSLRRELRGLGDRHRYREHQSPQSFVFRFL